MKTIRQQLLLGLSCAALACALAGGTALYVKVREEATELSDMQLRHVASALPARLTPDIEVAAPGDPEENFMVQVWGADGKLMYASQAGIALPYYAGIGFQTVRLAQDWRIYRDNQHGRLVQISQPVAVRDKLAGKLALRIMLPLLAFIPLFGILIYLVVGRAIRPLERVAQAVAGRSPSALQPLLLDGLPPELRPIVDALNDLLAKIEQAMTAQRSFVADAAHELRSPLTALKLHLQVAERAVDEVQRHGAFSKLHERLDRTSHLVQQLLTLARQEAEQDVLPLAPVDLHLLAQRAVADCSAYADSRRIDLGLDAEAVPVLVHGSADGLGLLLNNLLDNALRYTQPGGRVDVRTGMEQGVARLRVLDNGPGIAPAHRARVFDRFYRPDGNGMSGSGLGLAIVKNVAELHGAAVTLDDGPHGAGLLVTVSFPSPAG